MTETSTDPWSKPSESSSGDFLQFADIVGELLLITPTKYLEHQKTKFNADADCVVANVAVIGKTKAEGAEVFSVCKPEESITFSDVWILQGRLIGKTKGKVGKGMVLGRLTTEATDKGNAAYDLADPSPEDETAARAYHATLAPSF